MTSFSAELSRHFAVARLARARELSRSRQRRRRRRGRWLRSPVAPPWFLRSQIPDFVWGLVPLLRTRRHNKAMFSLLHPSSTTTSWVFVFLLHAFRLFLSRLVCVTKTFLFFWSMCVCSCVDSVWSAVVVTSMVGEQGPAAAAAGKEEQQ